MHTIRHFAARVAASALILLIAAALAALPAAARTLKMTAAYGGGPLLDIGGQAFAERVAQLTDGALQVKVYTAGKLGKPAHEVETVRSGQADLGHTWMGFDIGQEPVGAIFGGFAGSMDPELTLHWLYEGGGLRLWREFREERSGVVSLPLVLRTTEVFLHSRKPVRTLEDFKGLKIRTAGAWVAIAQQMGADTISLPGNQVVQALKEGTVEASEWGSLWENRALGLDSITSYVILPGVHQPVSAFELVINRDVWASLTARERSVIEQAAELTTFTSWARIGNEDAKALAAYRSAGQKIVVLDDRFQLEAKRLARKWADEQAARNEWFAKVWASQRAFETLWKDAPLYRRLAVTP